MNRLMLLACLATAACTHTWNGESNLNGYHSGQEAKSGLTDSFNYDVTDKRQSQFEDCMKVHEGEEDAEETCKDYTKAGMPATDERCDDCVDNPYYGWDRFYGPAGYGY